VTKPAHEPLNYHHLRLFWAAAREGSVTAAARELGLSQPTVSSQIRQLERQLGERLFDRSGRSLVLSEVGAVVAGYAREIFSLGREMVDTVGDRPTGRPLRVTVGVADAVPKAVAHRLLAPALAMAAPVRLVCREGKPDRLLAALALHELDAVLADAAAPPGLGFRAFSHFLGSSEIELLGTPQLAHAHRGRFPESLSGAPLLLPADNTSMRWLIEAWLDVRGVRPRILGEFEDASLLTAFGQAGAGLFPVPAVISREIRSRYGVERVGRLTGLRERFYAISRERRLKNPAVIAIQESARAGLSGRGRGRGPAS
jgi:LysR family transcriptional activator of nhaA